MLKKPTLSEPKQDTEKTRHMTVYNSKQLIDSLEKTSISHGLIIRSTQADFLRLLQTIEMDFPEIYVVYKADSVGKLWLKHGEIEAQQP